MKTNRLLLALFFGIFCSVFRTSAQTTPADSYFAGENAGYYADPSSERNTAVGPRAMFYSSAYHLTGHDNTAMGKFSLATITAGNDNTGIGSQALYTIKNGNANVAVGRAAGGGINNGSRNIFVGELCGDGIFDGNGNTFIGKVRSTGDVSNTIIIADGGSNTSPGGTHKLYITSDGKTGLGLDTYGVPNNRLEISLLGAVSGTLGLRFRYFNNTSVPNVLNKYLSVNNDGDVTLVDPVSIQGSAGTSVTGDGSPTSPYTISSCNIYTCDGTLDTKDHLRTVTMKDSNLFFETLTTEIAPDYGKIYIGTKRSFPYETGNYRLYVEGGILTEKVKVALRFDQNGDVGPNWKDYIFADDYKPMPLNEVEAYINCNDHLPGIESTDELVRNGLDLGDMQAKQMGKIEELTLYAIEQDKKIKQQGEEIEQLKTLVQAILQQK